MPLPRRQFLRAAATTALSFATLPRASAANGQEKPLNLVTYNIKRGFGMDRRTDLQRTIDYLRALNPDLLALQEIDQNCRRSDSLEQVALIAEALKMEGHFGKFMDFDGGEYGLAVFSRLPVEEAVIHILPEGGEPRVAAELIVDAGNNFLLSFVSLHLDWTTTERRLPQAEALTAALEDRDHPIILAGDFNAEPESPTMQHFAKTYHLVAKEGVPATFPSDTPKSEIDYFALRGFPAPDPLRCEVLEEPTVSDHRPVVMQLPNR